MNRQQLSALLWNVEWASPRSKRGRIIQRHMEGLDVMRLTECRLDLLPDHGHTITSGTDYGYPHDGGRRKVVLWSREPWEEVEALGAPGMPGGRFVTGVTMGIRFVGVCIPWKMAHVNNGRKDRKPWEDHLAYWDGLWNLIGEWREEERPVCLLGDINQTLPISTQPMEVLQPFAALDSLWQTWTREPYPDERVLDHVITNPLARARPATMIPKVTDAGVRLSDHIGIPFELETVHPARMSHSRPEGVCSHRSPARGKRPGIPPVVCITTR